MAATVIDGKALAAATKAEAAEKVKALKSRGINPCLAVILVGENPASQVYVRGKISDCAQCGIESRSINLPADTTQDALLAEVKKLADDSAVHGILVQLPLPAQIDEKAVIDAIPPEKDVDGFSPVNVGRMQIGEPCYLPCTPAGCIRMIESTGTDIAGKNAVVIGRSNIVGKPAALLLLAKNATVTICHSRTKNLKGVCAAADTVAGMHGFAPEMFTEEFQVEYYRTINGCLDERRFVVGEWPWNFADFSTQQGPMRVGSCNRKGLFTRERTPKLAAHYFRDRWGKKEPNDR